MSPIELSWTAKNTSFPGERNLFEVSLKKGARADRSHTTASTLCIWNSYIARQVKVEWCWKRCKLKEIEKIWSGSLRRRNRGRWLICCLLLQRPRSAAQCNCTALHLSNTVLWQKNNTHPEVLLLMCLMMDISLEMFDLFRGHCKMLHAKCPARTGWHCRLRAMFTPPIYTGMRRRPLFPPGHLPSHPHLRDLSGKAHVWILCS